MENFEIRTYGRTELALCYFPDLNPQVAYRKLQYWIEPVGGIKIIDKFI